MGKGDMFLPRIRIMHSYALDLPTLKPLGVLLKYPAKHSAGVDAWAAAGSGMGQLNTTIA